jgi:four helix bundle protein
LTDYSAAEGTLMNEKAELLKKRTKRFAIEIVRLFRTLPRTDEARVIGRQLLRSATSVAANYRSVCRARSRPDFISKVGVVVEEMDETVFWLEMLCETSIVPAQRLASLSKEAGELFAIFAASQLTVKGVNAEAEEFVNS